MSSAFGARDRWAVVRNRDQTQQAYRFATDGALLEPDRVPSGLHHGSHGGNRVTKCSRIAIEPRRASGVNARPLEELTKVAELGGEPTRRVTLDRIAPVPVTRLDAVEPGMEVRAAKVPWRGVDLIEEIGTKYRLVDHNPLRR